MSYVVIVADLLRRPRVSRGANGPGRECFEVDSLKNGDHANLRGDRMRRRKFLAGTLALTSVPRSALAQRRGGPIPTIGFMGTTSLKSQNVWVTAFVQRIRELGWIDQQNVRIEYRWAEGRSDRMAAAAAEFVEAKVDLIFAVGTEAAMIARKATSTIPIVFPFSSDPIGAGLVASLVFWRNYKIPMCLQIRFPAGHEEHQGMPIRQPR